MIKLAHGLSNPPRPDSIIGFVKLTTSPSAPLVSTLCLKPPFLGLFDKLEREDMIDDRLLEEAVSSGEDKVF